MSKIIYILLLFVVLWSCTRKEKDTLNYIELDYPEYFPKPNFPERNPLTIEGIALGEKLFFDTGLSANEQVSCASCHNPNLSFSDGTRLNSKGVSGNKLLRHTPALINLAWMDGLFWDGGVHDLESLPFAALSNPDEMGSDLFALSEKLNDSQEYKSLFKNAFGIDSISSAYIARALAQYQRTLVSSNSKYDNFLKGEIELSNEETKGLDIFNSKCASCHTPPLFTDNGYHNNGLDSLFPSGNLDVLKGRYRITQDSLDIGKYKTPTLRNLKYTAPYMHDGRLATLEDVLDHYQSKLVYSNTLDRELVNLSLNNEDKKYILSFLETLNDQSFVSQ